MNSQVQSRTDGGIPTGDQQGKTGNLGTYSTGTRSQMKKDAQLWIGEGMTDSTRLTVLLNTSHIEINKL